MRWEHNPLSISIQVKMPATTPSFLIISTKTSIPNTLNTFPKQLTRSVRCTSPMEAYDKLYPGYGSSYINFYGGAGFLFEQASSRGHVQETSTIPITFAFTIRNQFTASLATIRASLAEKVSLLEMKATVF